MTQMRIQMMTTVMTKICNRQSMRLTLLFSLWILLKHCKHQIRWGFRTWRRRWTSIIRRWQMVLLSTLTKEEQRLKRKNWKRHLLLQLLHDFSCQRTYYCWLLSFVLLALSSSQLFCSQIWDLILWLGSLAVEWVPKCLWGSEEKVVERSSKGNSDAPE